MVLRRSTTYLGTTAGLFLVLVGIFLHASWEVRASRPIYARKTALVRQLELTDLCLFTEASYMPMYFSPPRPCSLRYSKAGPPSTPASA